MLIVTRNNLNCATTTMTTINGEMQRTVHKADNEKDVKDYLARSEDNMNDEQQDQG